jgi:hypothetical protein
VPAATVVPAETFAEDVYNPPRLQFCGGVPFAPAFACPVRNDEAARLTNMILGTAK